MTKAEQLAEAHKKLIAQANAQPGVADVLRAYQMQTTFLSTYTVASQAANLVQQVRSTQVPFA
jgi:hypothetical protein